MNQIPSNPNSNTNTNSQTIIIITSVLCGILLSIAVFSVYMLTQKPNTNISQINPQTLVSSLGIPTNIANNTVSSVVLLVNIPSGLSNNTSITSNSKVAQLPKTSLKTLSCPDFDVSISLDKYKVGYDKFASDFSADDPAFLESAKQEILKTQSIECQIPENETEREGQILVKFVEKNFVSPCWFCGGSYVKSLDFTFARKNEDTKTISTTSIKNTDGLDGVVSKLSFEGMDGKTVNYNSITFKIKGIAYEIRTMSSSPNPTDNQNETLLIDATELFNSIKIK